MDCGGKEKKKKKERNNLYVKQSHNDQTSVY